MAGTLNLKSNPQLNSQEQKIVDRLIETEALKFGEFRLKSGRLAPFFLNVGDLGAGRELAMIADAYTTLIRREFASETGELHFDVLYGPTYKSIPIVAAIAMRLLERFSRNVRYCADCREIKKRDDSEVLLGGPLNEGDRVLIIGDVTTSGRTIDDAVPFLEKQKAQAVGEIILLDRRERAEGTPEFALETTAKKYGFPVRAFLSMDKVIEYLYHGRGARHGIINNDLYQKLLEYYEQYGGRII